MDVVWYGRIFLRVRTAVTGGRVRDVLYQIVPVLLHRETIGTSTLIGASTYVVLHGLGLADNISAIAGGLVVIMTRLISIKFDLHLPKFEKK